MNVLLALSACMKRCAPIALIAFSSLCLAQESLQLKDIVALLEQHAVLRADFSVTKKTAAVSVPLVSEGYMVLTKEAGLLWKTEKPFADVFGFSKKSVGSVNDREQWIVKPNTYFAPMQDALEKFLAGNTIDFERDFFVSVSGDKNHWSVVAAPRSQNLSVRLSEIQCTGSRTVQSLRIVQPDGTTTEVTFHHAVSNPQLSSEDQQLLRSLQ